ncbi:MAG TPA: hypothetical protein VL993_14815 [Stellaceae bacterium]|nr:hypothetical protein [Stellaceae bacterium]
MFPFDPLAALAELERRYDGAIPDPARRVARLGSPGAVIARQAQGQQRFFAALARSQLVAIRRRRGDAALVADLALYRRQWRRWRRVAVEAAP